MTIEQIKLILREKDVPYFSDDEIRAYLELNNNDVRATLYNLLLIKAENTSTNISGLSIADSSNYFRKLAINYAPNNTGILKRID